MSELIYVIYPDRPFVPDLFFSLLPKIEWLQYVSDPLMILSGVVFIWMILFHEKNKLPKYILAFGLIHIFRAFMIILTPMGRIVSYNESFGIGDFIQHGMFPSGHIAAATLFFLMTDDKKKGLKVFFFVFLLLQMIVLLFSRGHYSIDIVGGLMNAYIVNRKVNDYEDKLISPL